MQGAEEAGDRVTTLEVFKNAQNVKVDPDKPLQQARYVTLKVSTSPSVGSLCPVTFLGVVTIKKILIVNFSKING